MAMLDSVTEEVLRASFHQHRIVTVALSSNATARLLNEKFEGCVLPLNDSGQQMLEKVRKSGKNRRIVVYGVSESERATIESLRFGVNVILRPPIEGSEAADRVRSTTALLLHELRRDVRIPLAVPVSVHIGGSSFAVVSREVSGGGMSVELGSSEPPSGEFRLVFGLPETPSISVRARVAWHEDKLAGFKFEDSDASRLIVKEWINKWLDTARALAEGPR
jgi:hypothetical protein